MLLPSALPCDSRPVLRRQSQYISTALPSLQVRSANPQSNFATGINSTCRALHSLLGVQPPPSHSIKQLRANTTATPQRSSRVKKRPPPPPPRGYKRSRDLYEKEAISSVVEHGKENDSIHEPSTPKRQRRAPPTIPFGLDRNDFYNLHPSTPQLNSSPEICSLSLNPTSTVRPQHNSIIIQEDSSRDEEEWTDDDDSMLIDIVLDKMKLSRREWDECARMLGTDQRSLGQRWKYLVDEGQVGLKFRHGRRRQRADVRTLWQ